MVGLHPKLLEVPPPVAAEWRGVTAKKLVRLKYNPIRILKHGRKSHEQLIVPTIQKYSISSYQSFSYAGELLKKSPVKVNWRVVESR